MLLSELRFKKDQLNEKLKQLQVLLKMNNGQLPSEYVQWARNEEVVDKSQEVTQLRNLQEDLLSQIAAVTKQLDLLGPVRAVSYGSNRYYASGEGFY